MQTNPIYTGTRNLRRAADKFKDAIEEEVQALVAEGKSEEEATAIVGARLHALGLS